jgi:hypothetical protein
MSTSPRPGRAVLTAAVALLAVVLGAGPAASSTTWTVTPGGQFTGNAGTTTLKDTTTGSAITCARSSLAGMLKGGSGLRGAGIGSITSGGFTSCSTTFPTMITLRGLPWHINVTAYTDGVVHGTISHLGITVSMVDCSFEIDGTAAGASDGIARFSYSDATAKLKVLPTGGNLHIYQVIHCLGLVHTGDAATYTASYAISPAQTITSP